MYLLQGAYSTMAETDGEGKELFYVFVDTGGYVRAKK